MSKGVVSIVGAGPGDPGLITVKGREALERADVVLYDRLASPRLLEIVPGHCETIDVGKRPAGSRWTQEDINRTLVEKAEKGNRVVRLKGGDPFVFGRGGEEAAVLQQEGIPFDVVPGISSVTAVPAYAGIPVTHRDYNSSFAVVAGHEHPDKKGPSVHWEHLAKGPETLIILMGVSNLPHICERLIRHGRSPATPVALVRWGTRVEQETLTGTLSDIAERVEASGFKPPAVIVVGEVVRERERLSWYEPKPLFGRRVLVPRTREGKSLLAKRIKELGGEAVEFSVARSVPTEEFRRVIAGAPPRDWLLFSHDFAVEVFFRILGESGRDIREWAGVKVAVLGLKTAAALKEKGLQVAAFADGGQPETLVKAMEPLLNHGDEVLLVKGRISRGEPVQELRRLGCRVLVTEAHGTRTVHGETGRAARLLRDGKADWIAFASSSAVLHFAEAMEAELPDWRDRFHPVQVACIGPETARAAEGTGMRVDVEARQPTVDGLIQGILAYLTEEPQTFLTGVAD